MKRILIIALLVLLTVLLLPRKTHSDVQEVKTGPSCARIACTLIEASQVSLPHAVKPTHHKPLTEEQERVKALVIAEFKDAPIMLHVAEAENRYFDAPLPNPSPKSTATGIFQITGTTWRDNHCKGDVKVAEDNIACARILYNKSKLSPWLESKGTWSKYL